MASRARARKHLQQRIVSLFSALEPRIVPYTLEEILVTPLSASTPLKSLLTQLNDLAPIHILPSELLLAIISRRAFGSSQKRRRELAKLGAVCTSWRSLTLSSPRLWQHIDLRLTAYAALAVRRSQDIPVHIAFRVLDDESRSPGPEDYRTISDLAPRIASMKFSLPIDLYPELLDNFPLSLPLLHELGLSTVARENYIYTGTLPLGSASTLTLRVLNLSGVWLPWTLPLYRELVHLHVRLYHAVRRAIRSRNRAQCCLCRSAHLAITTAKPRLEDLEGFFQSLPSRRARHGHYRGDSACRESMYHVYHGQRSARILLVWNEQRHSFHVQRPWI
ncbi:hypothetical protein DENSPDRAFT_558636 [Dentipellis sp. KUC8613]|nr:hypothetical protein DENSPDRAFT_558636 [Dentipellis sp. KUC8613]